MFLTYEPAEDSFLIQRYVKKYAKGIVLDMGTGSGILAEEAAASKKVVKVFGVDKNEKAIIHCIRSQKSRKITYAMSDLFSLFKNYKPYMGIKFDTILFNAPYLPSDPNVKDMALDGGKKGHELIVKFLNKAKAFLKPMGKILLIFSSFTGKETLDNYISTHHWKYKEIDKVHISFEDIYLYLIENE
ncbi:MAG TPA: HemK2/MTQ2 family protein methyltransferase [Candidatus Nanoarchaeia archaeon]|nr:HemK2/MTQ2 family protein methyltransferase [Candidatus Nanoarchaeia archaeon]